MLIADKDWYHMEKLELDEQEELETANRKLENNQYQEVMGFGEAKKEGQVKVDLVKQQLSSLDQMDVRQVMEEMQEGHWFWVEERVLLEQTR